MHMGTGRRIFRAVTLALFLLVVLSNLAVAATPAPKPTVSQAKIVISMGADGNDTVEATYTIANANGLKDGMLEHLWVQRPGSEVNNLQASGAAQAPAVNKAAGISKVNVKVTGETATYTLKYAVKRQSGFAVPVLTPNLPVTKSESNVLIETMLPQGQTLAGENFPSLSGKEDRGGRTVLLSKVVNVPSVVIAEYGASRSISMSDVITGATILLFGFVFVLWFRHVQ